MVTAITPSKKLQAEAIEKRRIKDLFKKLPMGEVGKGLKKGSSLESEER